MDKSLFKLNAMLMRTVAMYRLDPNWSLPLKIGYNIWALIWIISLSGGFVFNILGILWGKDNEKISDVAINIVNIELFASILIRAFYFAKDNTQIDHLSERFTAEYARSTRFAFTPVTMDFIKKVSDGLIKSWSAFVFVAGLLMMIAPILKTPKELPYKIWFDVDNPMYYTLTLLVEFLSIEMMLISHSNMDMLNAAFMLLTAGQVDILASDFENVVHDSLKKNHCTEAEISEYMSFGDEHTIDHRLKKNDKIEVILKTLNFRKDVTENLKFCIERHQKLLSFIEEYQIFMSPYLLVEVNFNFSYLIFMLFTFVTIDNTSMYAPMSMYVSGCIAQIFLAMYLGDRLSSSIDNLRDKFYEMRWYLCESHFFSSYKIVQIRMSRTVSIFAGKLIPMSLDTFLEFMKKAFSFFTMLRQVN